MRKNNQITLAFNTNKIIIKLTAPLKKLDYSDWAHVILKTKNKSYKIMADDIALECFRSLYYTLKDIIQKKRSIHRLIKEDLGLMWNEICEDIRPEFPFKLIEGREYWLGLRYLLWSNRNKSEAWMFKKNKKIYLEVTPNYPWTFSKPKPKDKFYTFDEFVKNYKPLIILEIDMATAEKWYKKVSTILKDMQHNDDSLRIAYYKKLQEEQAF